MLYLLKFCLIEFFFLDLLISHIMLKTSLIIPAVIEKFKVKLALAIQIGDPATLVKEMVDTPPLVALKTIKTLSM